MRSESSSFHSFKDLGPTGGTALDELLETDIDLTLNGGRPPGVTRLLEVTECVGADVDVGLLRLGVNPEGKDWARGIKSAASKCVGVDDDCSQAVRLGASRTNL